MAAEARFYDSGARLHQVSESMLRQLCNDTSDTILIENNGVTPEWGCNQFSMFSIRTVLLASIIA